MWSGGVGPAGMAPMNASRPVKTVASAAVQEPSIVPNGGGVPWDLRFCHGMLDRRRAPIRSGALLYGSSADGHRNVPPEIQETVDFGAFACSFVTA